MKLNIVVFALLALSSTAAMAENYEIPGECKNLALMQAQLLQSHFHDAQMSGSAYNPSHLVLKTNNGLHIGKVTLLGGDSDEAGNMPCETQKDLCTNPAGAGGMIDWAQVEVVDSSKAVVADVIVSMGSRGGCTLSSAKVPGQN